MELEELKNLIKNKKIKEFKEAIDKMEYIDVASLIDSLSDEEQLIAFRMLPKDCAADVFAYLPSSSQ